MQNHCRWSVRAAARKKFPHSPSLTTTAHHHNMDVITKRLHISGLTPNISPQDLEGRFASFGAVKALDGLGKRDGNGDLRRYAYVTLEGSKAQVAKCTSSCAI